MPESWPGNDPAGDDDADDGALRPPAHPDDRLWRHPSEVAWTDQPGQTEAQPPPRLGRVWPLAITSAVTGAALALGIVALADVGISESSEDAASLTTLRGSIVVDEATGLTAIADAVLPSVVRIEVVTDDDERAGTGVVLLEDGHVLTNAHVVAGASSIDLVVADGTSVPGRVVGLDSVTDLAVVAPAEGHSGDVQWVPASRGSANDLDVGQSVVLVGAATDAALPSVSVGAITALGRWVATTSGNSLHGMIETDTPVAPGATGGALCDESGAVIGLSTTTNDGTGTGFATPIDAAWAVAEDLIDDGVVHHVWLGIEGTDAGADDGVLVERVLAGSPAEAAGLASGDLLVEIDGEEVATMSDLVMVLRDHEPADQIEVTVRRDDDLDRVDVTLAER